MTELLAPLFVIAIDAFLSLAAADKTPVPPDWKSEVFFNPPAENFSR